MARTVLFLGGTGIISSSCTRAAIAAGDEVLILNRGTSATRPAPDEATMITADLDDPSSVLEAIGDREFDTVCDFRTFTTDQLQAKLDIFAPRTGQYLFVSSASAYQTPPARQPVTEATPLKNPYWEYSRNKAACEDLLIRAYRDHDLPMTIVRPSHTYDRTAIPLDGGWTDIDRMRRGKPIVVHGDGTSLWTLTHADDFAVAFTGLLHNPAALGLAVHITSDEALSWNAIATILGHAAGAEPEIVHVPSDVIAAHDPDWGAGLLGDKAHTMIFDNSLVKSLVPAYRATIGFDRGADEIIAWYDDHADARHVDDQRNALLEELITRFR